MESLRNFGSSIADFWRSVIEWRSPATAPYLMLINTAFWATVFYSDAVTQLRILISLAAGIFGTDVLLSPSHDRSIAVHILSWPIHSMWRTLAVLSSLYSAHMLKKEELEIACWTAYSTVGCLLINPVWSYYEVNGKLIHGAQLIGKGAANIAELLILSPGRTLFAWVKYIVLLQFVPPLWASICNFFSGLKVRISSLFWSVVSWFQQLGSRIRNWCRDYILEPTKRRLRAFGAWLRYWFCAHWWPDLKAWMAVKIGAPLRRLFNYFCYCLVYCVCCHWLPPLGRWIGAKLAVFGAFLHRTVWVPTKIWLYAKCDELRLWMRRQLHRLAVAIRDSVLWPICVLIVDIGKEASLLVYRICVKPVLDYCYQRYKIVETAALVYCIGPVCETLVNNIPEKSPFCDDSDVELEGMLPDEMSDGAEIDGDAGSERPDSVGDLLPDTPIDEDENDFVSGLKFPTINASESSDEEFDLQPKTRKRVPRRRKPDTVPAVGGAEVPEPQGRSRRGYDDDFELLQ